MSFGPKVMNPYITFIQRWQFNPKLTLYVRPAPSNWLKAIQYRVNSAINRKNVPKLPQLRPNLWMRWLGGIDNLTGDSNTLRISILD